MHQVAAPGGRREPSEGSTGKKRTGRSGTERKIMRLHGNRTDCYSTANEDIDITRRMEVATCHMSHGQATRLGFTWDLARLRLMRAKATDKKIDYKYIVTEHTLYWQSQVNTRVNQWEK